MLFKITLVCSFLLVLFAAPSLVAAADEPFTSPSNWGGTGLMETPSARVMKEGRYRVGFSQVDPYRYYYGTVGLYEGLEVNGRVTEVLGVKALLEGYGNTKDKAVDFKYQLVSEGKYLPALAIGIMDPHGTRLYSSQFIAASKQIYPFDFTIGLGNGRFGKKQLPSSGDGFDIEILKNPRQWFSESNVFGGIQFVLSDHLTLMAEYSPTEYEKQTSDPAQRKYFREAVPSKFNFGLRWRPYDWAELDLTYQRGNQIGFNVSFSFDLGTPLIPIYDHPYSEPVRFRSNPLAERISNVLYKSGFSNIGVVLDDNILWIEAQNERYLYPMKAVGVALKTVTPIIPDNVGTVHLILKETGVPVFEYVTTRADLTAFENRELTVNEYFSISKINTDYAEALKTKIEHTNFFDAGLKPSWRFFVNDPSGFFKYKLGIEGRVGIHPWRGASFVAGVEGYPVNNISTSNAPTATPVRTDIVPYIERTVTLGKLLYSQVKKFDHEIYGRATGGILEMQYAGLDAEVAKPLFGGRLMVGLSGSYVKKRDPNNVFGFKENDYKDFYTTAFVNTRLNFPEIETSVELNTGQFLAGDRGTRITVSKSFKGLVFSAWYSITDTSIFEANSINRDYHDKGISVSIPLRLFKGSDSKSVYSMGISPWTRDVAQDIDHFNPLFDLIGRNAEIYLNKDRGLLQ